MKGGGLIISRYQLTTLFDVGSVDNGCFDILLFSFIFFMLLQYDNCWNLGKDLKTRYQAMSDALNATGRPIFFSLCEWGEQDPGKSFCVTISEYSIFETYNALFSSDVGSNSRKHVEDLPRYPK
jgi:hypothetical protein